MPGPPIAVPPALAASLARFYGDRGRSWAADLPGLVATFLDRWELTLDGPVHHGVMALVLLVRRPDGSPAALKLQPFDPDHPGEPSALRAWNGCGAVRLLDVDPSGSVALLERLRSAGPAQ